MGRYPELVIRIDVEHEIVNPVAENYDIVFAMLEAPLPSTGIVIRRVSSLERGLYAAPALLEKFGEPRTLEDLARLPMLTGPNDAPWAMTTPAGVTEHLDGAESAAGQFQCRHPAAGGVRRARRVAGDGELYQRGGRSRIAAADPCRTMSASRSTCTRCCRRGNSFRPRSRLPRCAGCPCHAPAAMRWPIDQRFP